jgi:hypothetical protein
LTIGIAWLLAAVAFACGFGRFVDGLSWSRLLADYDITRGRLLLLVWATGGADRSRWLARIGGDCGAPGTAPRPGSGNAVGGRNCSHLV